MKAFFAALLTKKVLIISIVAVVALAGIITGIVLAVNSNNDKPEPDPEPVECEHVAGDWIVEKEATCKEGGKRIKRCTLCSEIIANETLSVADHTPSDWIVDKAAEIGVEGKKHTECTVCYALIEEETIPALTDEHECTAGDWVETKATSCKEAGAEVKNCTECGKELDRREIEKLEHTPSDWIVDEEATETESGLRHKDCTVCGEKLEEETYFLPHEHVAGDWVTVDRATCSAKGKDVQYCTVCEEEINSREMPINASAHTPKSPARENEVEATCKAEGSYDLVERCEDCNAELSKVHKTTEKTAHTPADAVRENEVAATCTAGGSYDEVIYCSVCDEEISKTAKTTNKLAHTPADAVHENEVAATCTATGSYSEVIRCSVCNTELASQKHTVDKKPHTPKAAVEENRVDSTCARVGSYETVVYCEVCDGEISRTDHEIEMKDHSEGEWSVLKRASCTETGVEIKNCTACGKELDRRDTDTIPHVDSDWITDKPADIGVEGERHIECAICHTFIKGEKIPALEKPHEHEPGDWTVKTAATCTSTGTEIKNCKTCGEQLDSRTVPMTDHTEGVPTRENEVDPTCSETGSYEEVIKCTVCSEELSRRTKTIDTVPHTKGDQIIDREPTCAVEGLWHKNCTVCGEKVEEGTIDPLTTHTNGAPVQENVEDSTCTALGSYDEVVYCTVCNKEISRTAKTIEMKDHKPSAWKTDKEATCKEAGSKHTECTVCGETLETQQIDKLTEHTPAEAVKEKEQAATCTSGGSYDSVIYCSVCDAEISRTPMTTPKADHTESDYWVTELEPTCTVLGKKYTECTVCESVITRDNIPLKDHTPDEPVEENRKEATCSATGSYDSVVYCSVCKTYEISRTEQTIDIVPTAHKAGEWNVTLEPTCTETGTKVKNCEYCGTKVDEETIPEKGHVDKLPVEEDRVEPKCTVEGSYNMVTYCQTCGEKIKTEPHTIDPTGHSYGDWSVTTAPTESATGVLTRSCENDSSHKETKTLEELSTSNGYTYDVVKDPTCEGKGTGRYTVTVDGQTFTFDAEIAATGHTPTKGGEADVHEKCSVCGTTLQDGAKHSYTSEITTAATCLEKGTTTYTCACGHVYSLQDVAIDPNNHTGSAVKGGTEEAHEKYDCCDKIINANHSYTESITKAATCTDKGTKVFTCSCGYHYNEDIAIDANAHTGSPVNVGTKDVHQEYSCCNAPVGSHSYSESVTKAATCTETGTKKHTCTCGYSYETTIAATGHTEGAWETTVEATCTTAGKQIKKCTICGIQLKEETVAIKAHTASAAKTDPSSPNYTYTECTGCGKIMSRTFVAPATSGTTNTTFVDTSAITKGATFAEYQSGVRYDWTNRTLDYTGYTDKVNVIEREYINQTDLQAINGIEELGGYDRFLVINAGSGEIPFTAFSYNAGHFVEGTTYYITLKYYTSATSGHFAHVAGAGSGSNYSPENDAKIFTSGTYTRTIKYTVQNRETTNGVFYFWNYGSTAPVYIAEITVEVAGDGPTYSEMLQTGGYDWPMTDFIVDTNQGTHSTVGALTDAAAKTALTNAGYASTAPVSIFTTGHIDDFYNSYFFKRGYEYTITMKYYTATTGGYVIGLEADGPGGNHAVVDPSVGNPAFVAGYNESVFYYRPGAQGYTEFALNFYDTPNTVYMVGFNIKLTERTAAQVAIDAKPSTATVTADQLAAGYTFDFSAGNVPNLSTEDRYGDVSKGHYININAIPSSDAYAEKRDILSGNNNFKDYAFYVNRSNVYLNFTHGNLQTGKYRITMTIYLEDGASLNGMAVLPRFGIASSGVGDAAHFTATLVPGTTNVYTLTAEVSVDVAAGADIISTFYNHDTEAYYISSITMQKVG